MKKWLLTFMLCIALPLQAAETTKGKVIVVMSNADQLKLKEGRSVDTGFFLNEFIIPVQELMDAGYQIVVATPQGRKPNMDKGSKNPMFFGDDAKKMHEAFALSEKVLVKKNIKRLKDVADSNLDEYVGVFVPGGHAPMVDLMVDPSLGKILADFHKKGKPTAMICHGPIAAISTMESPERFRKSLSEGKDKDDVSDRDWIYKDYKMTVFSNKEEADAEKTKLKGKMEYYAEDALNKAGASVENADPKESNVVTHKELITGQNPASDAELAKEFIEALDKGIKK